MEGIPETPAHWTLTCCTTDGRSVNEGFDSYVEALVAVQTYLERPDCELVTIGCNPDWSRVTLFMFTPEVPK